MSMRTYRKGAFNKFWLVWYQRKWVWWLITAIPCLFIYLIIHVLKVFSLVPPNWLTISQKSYTIALIVFLCVLFGLFLRDLWKYKVIHYIPAKFIERSIKKNLLDTMLLNNPKYLDKAYVPALFVDLSEDNKVKIQMERLAGMDNVEQLLLNVSNALRGKYIDYAIIDYLEYQNKAKFEFTAGNVEQIFRLKPKTIEELIHKDLYTFVIQDGLTYDSIENPHLMLSSKTGGGKSYFLMGLMLQMLYKHTKEDDEKGTGLHLFDSKREFSTLEFFKHRIYSDTNEYLDKMRDLVALMNEREKEFAQASAVAGKMSLNGRDLGFRPIFIVVEELAATVGGMDSKQRKEWDSLTSQILYKGRQISCFYWVVSQSFHSSIISTSQRNNFNFRVLLGNSQNDDISYVFGSNNETVTNTVPKYTGFYMMEKNTQTPQRIAPTDISDIKDFKHFEEAYNNGYDR